MALKTGTPNKLAYFDLQRVKFAAGHFAYMHLDKYSPQLVDQVNTWITTNLNNRYYVGQDVHVDSTGTVVFVTRIGFESERDLCYFRLAAPFLHI